MKKLCLRLPGRRKYIFWNFDILAFSTFKRLLSKFLRKNLQVSKQILKVLIKFYRFTSIYDLKFLDNETTALWFFFEICTEEPFASEILSNRGNIKDSILLILLKCIVAGFSNESFTVWLFSNYEPLNMQFRFLRYLTYSVFHETFVKKFMKKLSCFSWNFKTPFQDVVYYWKLGCLTLWYWNETRLHLKLLLGFSAEPVRTCVNDIQVK